MIVEISDVVVMRGCMCGPHKCSYCNKKIANNKCTPLRFDITSCPHCGYPTQSVNLSNNRGK